MIIYDYKVYDNISNNNENQYFDVFSCFCFQKRLVITIKQLLLVLITKAYYRFDVPWKYKPWYF